VAVARPDPAAERRELQSPTSTLGRLRHAGLAEPEVETWDGGPAMPARRRRLSSQNDRNRLLRDEEAVRRGVSFFERPVFDSALSRPPRYESKRPLSLRAAVLGGHPATAERLVAALPADSAGGAVSHASSHGTV
jgi:hypothetical protein